MITKGKNNNSLMGKKNAAAAAAKARMAKRAKRQRFLKENKKRILIGVVTFVAIVLLAVMTPWGPDYYYGKIQARRMETPGVIQEGVIRDLYKLGVFYQNTMRKDDAQRIYNEIATISFGFTFTEFAQNPDAAFAKRSQAEANIKKGIGKGPPYPIPESDQKYVGLAIWRMGETMDSGPRQFTVRVYEELYMNEFLELHPQDADPEITGIVKWNVDRFYGRR